MQQSFVPENRLLFALAVLFIPIFDTLRVIIIRLRTGKTLFEADRNHMHHVLLDNGRTHKQASFLLGGINLLVIGLYVLLSQFLENIGLTLAMIVIFLLAGAAFDSLKKRARKRNRVVENSNSV